MARMKIKNFGPIHTGLIADDGWIYFNKVTIFIGNQGSGKSTIAKLFSTFSWIEKAYMRGDYEKKWFERKNRLKNQFLGYHRLDNYYSGDDNENVSIEYEGDALFISYKNDQLHISETNKKEYGLPQIMYVPAERNFISYVRNPKELKLSSESLKEFLAEFDNAKYAMKTPVELPINKKTKIEYDKLNDMLSIAADGYKIRLSESSSGYQSVVPVYIVSSFLSDRVREASQSKSESMSTEQAQRFRKNVEDIYNNIALTDEQKRIAISVLSAKFKKVSFINIVEEPEQNLFPPSQWELVKTLLLCNNKNIGNKLVITTHSPYIVSYMGVVNFAFKVYAKIGNKNPQLTERLNDIIDLNALISNKELSIYQCNDDGCIEKLSNYEGIPSSNNYLNSYLKTGNSMFDSLLEIDEEI